MFGWTNRTQFEETWVSLLAALNPGLGPDTAPDEAQSLVQVRCLANVVMSHNDECCNLQDTRKKTCVVDIL